MENILNTLGLILFLIFTALASPFVVAHVMDNWNEPEYPHSGFTPEYPTWENTLPTVTE